MVVAAAFPDFAVPGMTVGYSHRWVKAKRTGLSSGWALLSDVCELQYENDHFHEFYVKILKHCLLSI